MGSQGDRRTGGRLRFGAGAVLLAALAACGGGGGGDAAAASNGNALGAGGGVPPPTVDASGSGPVATADPNPAQLRAGEYVLNTTTAGDQGHGAVAALPGGGFVAVWSTNTAGASDVRMQRFGSDGRPLGAERVVAELGHSPGVTTMAGGGFLVSWSASPYMYEANGHVQRFDAQGTPLGGPVQVAAAFFKYVTRPLGLPDGSFVLAVDTSTGRFGAEQGLVTRYTAEGTPLGTPVRLTSELTPQTGSRDPNWAGGTTAAGWPDGRFAVAWVGSGTGVSEVRLSRFDAQGNLQGTQAIATDASLQQPAIAVLAGGQLAVAWVSGTDAARTVWLEVFGADGTSLGRQAVASGIAANLVVPKLAALDTGGVVLAWKVTRYGETAMQRSVQVQRFGAAGQAAGAAEPIASIEVPLEAVAFDMDSLDVTAGGGGSWLVMHGGYSQAGGWDVRATAR